MTFENSQQTFFDETAFPLMSSAAASRAKISVLPAREQALKASAAGSGLRSLESLAKYDPFTSSWRTSQHCLVEGLQEFSETWPRSGTMLNGTAYLLPQLVHLTEETVSGLWPTPTLGGGGQTLPEGTTPTGRTPEGRKQTVCLERYVQNVERRMWPTPTVAMHKGSSPGAMVRLSGASRLNDRLDYAVEQGKGNGRLNPTWVEWLMGFPLGWTELKGSETP